MTNEETESGLKEEAFRCLAAARWQGVIAASGDLRRGYFDMDSLKQLEVNIIGFRNVVARIKQEYGIDVTKNRAK